MQKLTADKKIEKAKVGLYLDAPFFASICLRLEMIEDKTGTISQTMATDGKSIYFYPPFVDDLTLDETKGVSAHEVGHVILLHPFRRGNRNHRKWNRACDHAINHILIDSGFKLPKGYLDNPAYYRLEAEAIYNLLPDEPQDNDPGQGEGTPGQGDPVIDYPAKSVGEMKQAELEQKMYNVQAASIAKKAGNLPGSLERLIEELTEPKINWKETLSQFVDARSKNDFTWTTPNRKYLSSGYFLPSLLSPQLGEIVCLIDASGSVSEAQLKDLASEVKGITELYTGTELKVIFFDTQTSEVFSIQDDTDLKGLKIPSMGGGTDYRPPFQKIEKEGLNPVAVIVLTDGCCHRFPQKCDFPTLWVINSKEVWKSFQPPFGDKIYMEGGE